MSGHEVGSAQSSHCSIPREESEIQAKAGSFDHSPLGAGYATGLQPIAPEAKVWEKRLQ